MNKHYRPLVLLIFTLILLTLLLAPANVVRADGPGGEHLYSSLNYCDANMPCSESMPPAERARLVGPALAMRAQRVQSTPLAPELKGGPDAFGYKWNDTIPFNWIDATGGVNTGMTGDGYHQKVGPIALPFKFKYYEHSYKMLYIAAPGFISFSNPGSSFNSQGYIPNPTSPNNIIAPYWTPVFLPATGHIYYKSGGTKPNRYFVVEWHDVRGGSPSDSYGGNDTFRFEVILYENGNIVFQYAQMSYIGSYWCGTAGIEDSLGADGLTSVLFCRTVSSNKAVRFTRPAPAARASIFPVYQGQFVAASDSASFRVPIRNTGDLGADTFDITTSSVYSTSLFMADGITPLPDTDADTFPDTGALKPGKTATVVVQVQIPGDAAAGNSNDVQLTATSSLNGTKSSTTHLQTAVPSDFTQVFEDYTNLAMSLDIIQPTGQSVVQVTPNNYYGYDPGINGSPNGNYVYGWTKGRCASSSCYNNVEEIEYALRDHTGAAVTGIKKLKPLGSPASSIYQYGYGLGAASNNSTGAAFIEETCPPGSYCVDNTWFALLNSAGTVTKRVNITQNVNWGGWLYNARVAATIDGHFVVVWQREVYQNNAWIDDIYFTIFDGNGHVTKPLTKYTNAKQYGWFYSPTAVPLADGNVLLAFTGYNPNSQAADLYYGVLSSGGNKVKALTNLTHDANVYDWYYVDAAQLNNGNIVMGWNTWDGVNPNLRYATLDSSFNLIAGPSALPNPAALLGDGPMSISPDSAGNAVVTWHDYSYAYRRNLYYALLDGTGNVVTPPIIFRSSSTRIDTSYDGNGNAPH